MNDNINDTLHPENVGAATEPMVILRESVMGFALAGERDRAIPLFMLFANSAGFRWLARHFERRAILAERIEAEEARGHPEHPDPDDHEQLTTHDPPFVAALSDLMSLRTGVLTDANCQNVFDRFEINEGSASHGSVQVRYARLIDDAKKYDDT